MRAIILAAGRGARMGGPKARLLVSGHTLVARHVARLREAKATSIVVVLRSGDEDLVPPAADTVVALSAAPDQAGSLARGLDALGEIDEPILVAPVDTGPAAPETIEALARAVREGASAAIPTFEGRGGHPVVVHASTLRTGRGIPLRDVLAQLGARCVRLPVSDPMVLVDLDEPADVARVHRQPVRFRVIDVMRPPPSWPDTSAMKAREFDDVEVRDLRATDLEWVVRIDREHSGAARTEYFRVKLAETRADTGVRVSLAAVVDGLPAGFMMGRLYYGEFGSPEPFAILDSLGVAREYAGRRVGRALLEQFQTNLRGLGIERIETQVAWDQIDLLRFFQRAGFRPAARLCLDLDLSRT